MKKHLKIYISLVRINKSFEGVYNLIKKNEEMNYQEFNFFESFKYFHNARKFFDLFDKFVDNNIEWNIKEGFICRDLKEDELRNSFRKIKIQITKGSLTKDFVDGRIFNIQKRKWFIYYKSKS